MKVAHHLQSRIEASGSSASIIDLSRSKLPLWDEEVWAGAEKWTKVWSPLASMLGASDSLVVISPEYGGMAAPALKNLFLFTGGDLIAHKPALLVSVTSSAVNGAYPVSELRSSGHKNSRLVYIPDHVIIRESEKHLNSDSGGEAEAYLRTRIDYSISVLGQYAVAMRGIRESGVVDLKTYPFGM